ncbi:MULTISPECIES: SAM-dependent methyltransferase [unclassified Sphingopyxis]|uniref:SAM-dependent methyltransferase n=1 Tax=unclassified Sphingopyxis TaxID=2614943 RepID=UPI000730DA8A|nr:MULTISPECIES: cyclopropane-fatty-acyl-phospholipid synthase family protein [unclassified Sphingopyxis]KTE01240.1 cyclopropane-fatty-acyl-phospholipid synthase [Sphingopyxis sp. H012]KTE12786.1 cyclopropane-fatty-acyl-phospholipid synthase [Sphingopyxis sp. H053]KTE14249.1 cyclopropane-fatty-acyl-phospholipid synthase [Sphingopyxis sp. H093]KTE23411.1 cyclopropane-fatty-acyl-phospholipid synthase [Sphingopyxis sp. H080]KTE34860.1 cyclopropane-fatty-acyl-phospholipid synthase [Sphingopyxis sp
MSILAPFLSRVVRQGRLTVIAPDGAEERFGTPTPGFPELVLRFKTRAGMRRIILDPRLGAAESFMDGDMRIEGGDIMDLIGLIRMNTPWDRGAALKDKTWLGQRADWVKTRIGSINRQRRSRANVRHHYDIGNDLYRLFLDDDMQYSCAYWPRPDMTLEEAQVAKKTHIAAKLALKPGQRVLDIGCGWGGMAITLAKLEQVEVLGITLSEEQFALARQRAEAAGVADRVKFELVDYRDLAAREPGRFDRIVSVGMFEHVGAPNFETFFRAAANLMTADGVMLLHTIGRFGRPGATDAFTRKYIFPGGYIPALSETLAASEKSRLIATDIETLRLHYALTLRQWYARTLAHEAEIVAMMGERFFRMWTFYLAGATSAFESGGMGNYQIQFARSRHALPLTRDYIAATEEDFGARWV